VPDAAGGEPAPKPTADPVRVVIEFDPGTEVAGRLAADGPATEFRGRLELYAALERAREGG
jgi:hypothetical protein